MQSYGAINVEVRVRLVEGAVVLGTPNLSKSLSITVCMLVKRQYHNTAAGGTGLTASKEHHRIAFHTPGCPGAPKMKEKVCRSTAGFIGHPG